MYTWPLEGLSVVKGNFHAAFLGGLGGGNAVLATRRSKAPRNSLLRGAFFIKWLD